MSRSGEGRREIKGRRGGFKRGRAETTEEQTLQERSMLFSSTEETKTLKKGRGSVCMLWEG